MKNIRIIFSLFLFCTFSIIVTAQTNTNTADLCLVKGKKIEVVVKTKTVKTENTPRKVVVSTKQRRLKSYQSNHKIARKRKATVPENTLAVSE